MKWRPRSVRMRLTMWYALALSIILVLYAGGVFALVSQGVYRELDDRVREDYDVAKHLLANSGNGEVGLRPDGRRSVAHGGEASNWLAVWSGEHDLLYEHRPHGHDSLQSPESISHAVMPSTVTLPGGERVRRAAGSHSIDGRHVVIAVARSEERVRSQLSAFLLILLLALPVAVGIAALGGAFLAGRALTPVAAIAAKARTITAERLSERLDVGHPDDEFGKLATVFNETLARLENSFAETRRFTADASHELRTPLTSIRSVGEVGLSESRDEPAYRAIIGSILEEVDRMTQLVDGLLSLTRADGSRVRLQPERIDLAELADDVATLLAPLAEERAQEIAIERTAAGIVVSADRAVVRQAVVNLVDNAIKYGNPKSRIVIRVSQHTGAAALEVVDTGPGLAPEHRERVFERFYRIDDSRARASGGSGLGLAIARRAIEIHGGHIELDSELEQGSVFRILLPIASP